MKQNPGPGNSLFFLIVIPEQGAVGAIDPLD